VRTWVHPDDACFLDGREAPLLPRGRRGQLIAALGRVVDLCPPVFRLEPLDVDAPLGALQPLATPGHTPGHVCFWHAADRALISGDALLVDGADVSLPADPLSEEPARARASLRALRGLPLEHLLPGHGPPLLGNARPRLDSFLDALTGC
jgi:glyoxylase-like metal-dependent hydrolase (beta-lactamase superfamily II)